ncbi:dna double-strand break repair and vj recombination xrcc4 [Diplodia corticola]|uniref:Non-homologous end-joining factor 1 n=1 Tax=Diplodia corticola TaxID=236234 RepID=A0A1J9SKD2_9PEZI|nr:dna double-strand break repair and vj recombination xrcc4 [Diplodia corticola]OJD40799.1 dna double-strand break repair and vj recombination xrcc4 [Diplodia corticola]
MEVVWKPLRVDGAPASCPPLFAKTQFTANSYVVFLTDLRHVWKESMDRRNICKQALLEETPIDPTEDATQMHLLLDRIRDAIEARAGTRRQLLKDIKDPRALRLHISASLPGSLRDLQWMMNCKRLPPISLQHHLVSPLIRKTYHHMQQVDDLIARLAAKDHVISKLLDRLEASGSDVTSVFPGATGPKGSKRLTPREQAARQVHGLGPFDSKRWQQSRIESQTTRMLDASLHQVLGLLSASTEYVDGEMDTDDLWPSTLPSAVSDSVDAFGDKFGAASIGGDASKKDGTPVTEEDEFERQDTPPKLRRSKDSQKLDGPKILAPLHQRAQSRDPDETTDDEDLDAPSSQCLGTHKPASLSAPLISTSPERKPPVIPPSPKKLGRLGGRTSNPPEQTPMISDTAADEESTASETEDEDATDIAKAPGPVVQTGPSSTDKPAGASSRKGKLGVLGGKKTPTSANGSASSTPPPATVSVPGGVRSISGGNRTAESSLDDFGAERASIDERSQLLDTSSNNTTSERRSTSTGDPSVTVESEQERANRKREELKRTLEKSQGPKKKRKF